jgi:hypothetical protein
VFVGLRGIGPWQDAEQAAVLNQFVKRRKAAVIPVVTQQLMWGITGRSAHLMSSE